MLFKENYKLLKKEKQQMGANSSKRELRKTHKIAKKQLDQHPR